MQNKKIEISYREYASASELPAEERELLEQAVRATAGSYAPYSSFNVGAAVRLSGGAVVTGANQENIAYPSGLCAERTALFSAHSRYPDEAVVALAIVSAQNGKVLSDPPTPCGACRQVMAESQMRAGKPMEIILGGSGKVLVFDSVESVLPFIFDSSAVHRGK